MNDIRLVGSVELQAAGDGKPATFKLLAYTGAVMRLGGYGATVVDGAGVRAEPALPPVLRDHSPEKIVGHTTALDVNKKTGEIVAAGIASGAGPDAAEVIASARNGFGWQCSIGASVERTEYLEAGAKAVVNGRTVTGPLVIVRSATLREISFVAVGADGATSAAIAAKRSPRGTAMSFDDYLAGMGLDPAAMSDDHKAALRLGYDAAHPTRTAAPAKRGASPSAVRQIVAQFARECPDRADEFASIAAAGIEGGDDEDTIESRLTMFALRASGGGPNVVHRDGGSRPVQADLLTASLLGSCGMQPNEVAKYFDQRTVDAAVSARNRGAGLQTVLRTVLRAAGQHAPDGRLGDDAIRSAFAADRRLQASVTP